MTYSRPGVKVRFWTPRHKNKPSLEPPGLLRLASALAVLSVAGSMMYSVFATLQVGFAELDGEVAAYVAVLHFVLPLCITYSISSNSPLSRVLILAYCLILYIATMAGKGFLGGFHFDAWFKEVFATALLVVIVVWLYRTPKMRVYYALVADRPVPEELAPLAEEMMTSTWPGPRLRAALEWTADRLEMLVLFGLIVVVLYAFATTG